MEEQEEEVEPEEVVSAVPDITPAIDPLGNNY